MQLDNYKMLSKKFLVLAILALFAPLASAQSSRSVVRIPREFIAQKESLLLGDLAEISTADPATADRLRSISLGYAPDVGALREISREKITLAITAAGFSVGSVELIAPPATIVRRESQTVDLAAVREAVERAVLPTLQAKGATARLIRLDLPGQIEVRSGTLEVRASIGAAKTLFAPFMVSLDFWIDGRIAQRLSTTAQVEAYAPVLVATHDLSEKARVRPTDFTIAVKKLERDDYLTDLSQVRGVSLTRALVRGEAVTADARVAEIVIKTGDSVRIIGESGSLTILVQGEARAAGHVGDRIQVKNPQSGMLFQAVIVDEGLVSVRF